MKVKDYLLENEEEYKKLAKKFLKEARGAKKVKLHNLYVDIWGGL